MPLLLTERDVRRVLSMGDLITAMEAAVGQFSAGSVQQPVRTIIDVGASRGFFGVMPAFTAHPPALGSKLVTVFNGNTARGLPTHLATIVLLDPDTGALRAVMDGRYITEARTAAVSAVATRHLARPQASRLAVIGSGVQARSHIEALARVRPIRDIRVWSPTAAHREQVVREMAPQTGVSLRAMPTPRAAIEDADLVVLATSATNPVFDAAWIGEGAHVTCVGACRPDQREMDPSLVARARLFVDSRAAALVESGDIVMGMAEGRFGADHIAGEIGEVVLGRIARGGDEKTVTVFKSLGMAVEDVTAADLAYRNAIQQAVGTPLQI